MAEDKKVILKSALMYFQEGRWDKAIPELRRLIDLDADDLKARDMLADAYLKKGSLKEAYEEYAYAADGYVKKGEPEKSKVIYKKMAKLEVKDLDAAQQKRHKLIALEVNGDDAFERGGYDGAVAAYQQVIQFEPKRIEVVAKLAEAYSRMGKNSDAVPQFLKVAKYAMENRLFKKAMLYYQKVAELDPASVDARLTLGDLLSREGQELEARKEFQSVAEWFLAQGDLERAQSCCQKAVQLKSIDAHYILGQVLFQQEKYEDAASEFEGFLKIKPNHPNAIHAQYMLGMCRVKQGALDDAMGAFGTILGKQSDHVESIERMAEIYEQKGSIPDAVTQWLSLSGIYAGRRLFDRAEAAIRKAIGLDADHVDARKKLGELFDLRGMKREAANEFVGALNSARQQNLAAEVKNMEARIKAIDPSLLDSAPAAPPPAAAASPPAADVAAPPPGPAIPPPPVAVALGPPPSSPPPLPAAAPAAPAAVSKPPAPKPKATLTPEQRAQRMVSMAKSALKQGLYDDALDLFQSAQQLMPENQELKEMMKEALRGFTRGSAAAKKAAAPKAAPPPEPPKIEAVAPAPPAPAPAPGPMAAPSEPEAGESVEDIEKRIRAKIEKEYHEKKSTKPESEGDLTREQVLARAGDGEESPPEPEKPQAPPPAPPPSPVAAPAAPVRARPRVSYV